MAVSMWSRPFQFFDLSKGKKMFEGARDLSLLAEIKHHVDFHGFGSVIIDDHVAIGLSNHASGSDATSARPLRQTIVRVKSLEEARCAIGCCCERAAH